MWSSCRCLLSLLLWLSSISTTAGSDPPLPVVCGTPDDFKECLNGGTCLEIPNPGGSIDFHCDCRTAIIDDVHFAGRTCQFASTVICPDDGSNLYDDLQAVNFCTNNGTCGASPIDNCDCTSPYTGPHCEFNEDHDHIDAQPGGNCTLVCKNDGVCKEGAKDLSAVIDIGPQSIPDFLTHNGDFEHCACKDGYAGLDCGVSVQVCGQGEHMCLHGSKCVPEDQDVYSCDCDDALTEALVPLAGIHCEHEATGVCDPGDNGFVYQEHRGFCVNHGQCMVNGDGEAYCQCLYPWHGPHCEFHVDSDHPLARPEEAATHINKNTGPTDAALAAFLVVSILLGLALVVYVARRCLGTSTTTTINEE